MNLIKCAWNVKLNNTLVRSGIYSPTRQKTSMFVASLIGYAILNSCTMFCHKMSEQCQRKICSTDITQKRQIPRQHQPMVMLRPNYQWVMMVSLLILIQIKVTIPRIANMNLGSPSHDGSITSPRSPASGFGDHNSIMSSPSQATPGPVDYGMSNENQVSYQ